MTLIVVDDDKKIKSNTLVCGCQKCHPDDIEGRCSSCKRPVFYRPYNARFKFKICMVCASRKKKVECYITKRTLREVQEGFNRQRQRPAG